MTKDDALLLEAQVADLLNVSPRTVEGWRRRNEGPPFVKLAHHVRYKPEDVKTYLDTNSHQPVLSRSNP